MFFPVNPDNNDLLTIRNCNYGEALRAANFSHSLSLFAFNGAALRAANT